MDRLTELIHETRRLKDEAAELRRQLAELDRRLQAINTEMLGIMQTRGLQNVTTDQGEQAYVTAKIQTVVTDPVALLRWCARNKRLDILSPRVVASRLVDADGQLILRPDGVEVSRFFHVAIRKK